MRDLSCLVLRSKADLCRRKGKDDARKAETKGRCDVEPTSLVRWESSVGGVVVEEDQARGRHDRTGRRNSRAEGRMRMRDGRNEGSGAACHIWA